jgi:hypothetical protein
VRRLIALGIGVFLLGGCGADDRAGGAEVPELGSAAAEQAWTCLEDEGFDVLGGRSGPSDRDAPDVELTFSDGAEQVFIGFYGDDREAARREPAIRKGARDFGGRVERRGSVTIVWGGESAADSRERVEACAFG